MTPKQIKRKWESIDRREQKLADELKALQSLCQHPNATKKYDGSTGNYDRTADCYWIDHRCPDCDKRWRTDQ